MNRALTGAFSRAMRTKSSDRLYGTSVRIAAERAAEARREADKLACDAWTKRMLAFKRAALAYPRRRAQRRLHLSRGSLPGL